MTVAVVILGLTSCSKNKDLNTNPSTTNTSLVTPYSGTDTNIVNLSTAKKMAERLTATFFKTDTWDKVTRTIDNAYSIDDANGIPALYVFNYSNGSGFSIMAADIRYQPILAFAENGSLNLSDTVPSMLKVWALHNTEIIGFIRETRPPRDSNVMAAFYSWATNIDRMGLREDIYHMEPIGRVPFPDLCDKPYGEFHDNILATTWGQGVGYNDQLTTSVSCSNYSNNKPPTGCVATAVAQILKHHAKPNANHNYSAMPNNYGTSQTQILMQYLGLATYLDMDYACDGSGASSAKVRPTLISKYGYNSNIQKHNYETIDRWNINTDITNNRPVYLAGCGPSYYLYSNNTFTATEACHAWLVTGCKISGTQCYKHFWYYMNWGWGGYLNLWVYENNWDYGSLNINHFGNFNNDREIIYNIKPF
jgi:hypothetical protein